MTEESRESSEVLRGIFTFPELRVLTGARNSSLMRMENIGVFGRRPGMGAATYSANEALLAAVSLHAQNRLINQELILVSESIRDKAQHGFGRGLLDAPLMIVGDDAISVTTPEKLGARILEELTHHLTPRVVKVCVLREIVREMCDRGAEAIDDFWERSKGTVFERMNPQVAQ